MKKFFYLSTALFFSMNVMGQTTKTVAAPKTSAHLKAFNVAATSGDINTAITTLNYYIAEQGDNSPYADTLAMLYMQQGAYAQCYFWADKRLKVRPDDNALLELKGMSLDKLQQPKEAIDVFEKLFVRSKNPYHAYKLMELQYGIKRLAECVATANAVERLQFKPEYTMTYNVGEQVGRTYLEAGVYNIHGLALYDLDKKTEAKAYFAKAVSIDSNFVLARQNIEAIRSIETGGPKAGNSNTQPNASPANKQN